MTLRRFTALGLAAFMLHLNVVRADVACAAHAAPAGQGAPTQHDMDGMHGGDDLGVSEGVAADANCETPAQKDCCQAMTSCAPMFGFGEGSQLSVPAPSHETVGAPFVTRPLSRSAAPEPPPPRL